MSVPGALFVRPALGAGGCEGHQRLQGGRTVTLHRNARTCPRSRRLLADRVLLEGWSLAAAAEAAGVSERTAWKWVDRFRREGEDGLEDRSSAPASVPSRTPAEREELIVMLRELRFTSPE